LASMVFTIDEIMGRVTLNLLARHVMMSHRSSKEWFSWDRFLNYLEHSVEIVSNKIAWLFRMSSAVGFFKAVLMNF